MNELEQDDFEIEMSDLPDTGNARQAPALMGMLAARPRLRSRLWRAATVGSALILFLLALNGNFSLVQQNIPGLSAHPTPSPTDQSSAASISQDVTSKFNTKKVIVWNASTPPVVSGSETLGPVPQSCPQETSLQNFVSPVFPPGVGGSPLWVTGFVGQGQARSAVLNHLVRAKPPQFGWYQQLTLVAETNYAGTVTLQGGIVGSTFPLWFGTFPHNDGLINTISVRPLDTSAPNHFGGDQQWGTLPIHVYIAQAGCYYLQATWDGGSWVVYFAAGQ